MQVQGRADEIAVRVEQQQRQLARCITRLAEATGQPAATVESDLRSGRMLTAENALDYGLMHELMVRTPDTP